MRMGCRLCSCRLQGRGIGEFYGVGEFRRDANSPCRLAAWLDMIAGDEREEL
jgi:hypothetical protein